MVQAGLVDKPWPTPISVPDASFNFKSAMASSIEKEELLGYLDGGEIGHGLFRTAPPIALVVSPGVYSEDSTPSQYTFHYIH